MNQEDIEAHAASMEQQPWWALHLAEQALPPCQTCGGFLDLLLDGAGWCEDCNDDGLCTDETPCGNCSRPDLEGTK